MAPVPLPTVLAVLGFYHVKQVQGYPVYIFRKGTVGPVAIPLTNPVPGEIVSRLARMFGIDIQNFYPAQVAKPD